MNGHVKVKGVGRIRSRRKCVSKKKGTKCSRNKKGRSMLEEISKKAKEILSKEENNGLQEDKGRR